MMLFVVMVFVVMMFSMFVRAASAVAGDMLVVLICVINTLT